MYDTRVLVALQSDKNSRSVFPYASSPAGICELLIGRAGSRYRVTILISRAPLRVPDLTRSPPHACIPLHTTPDNAEEIYRQG